MTEGSFAIVHSFCAHMIWLRAAQIAPHAPTRPESQGGADAFTGPRSLASARLFLFDISELMFAPREKALAQQFRDALREARDASAMLEVSREMLISIEALAGPARASAIRDRLDKLLPDSAIGSV